MAMLVSWRAVAIAHNWWGNWASSDPPGPASVFAKSVQGSVCKQQKIAHFVAVDLPDRHCLYPYVSDTMGYLWQQATN